MWLTRVSYITRHTSAREMICNLEKNKKEALWGLFIADALAMPVHWYYNPSDIKRDYGGWLTGYVAPVKRHPSSILTLSAVDGSGRTGWRTKAEPVIGSVILHDKLKYWTNGDRSTHYHQGMHAGDNTLNALTALETVKVMQNVDPTVALDPQDLNSAVMENYVKFMTTPGTHNDTYAESFHRSFFQEWNHMSNPPKKGADILKFCDQRFQAVSPENEDSQLPVISALVLAVPWILHYAHKTTDECSEFTVQALKLTHPAPSLMPYIDVYAGLLHSVLNGADLKSEVLKAAASKALGGSRKKETIQKMSKEIARYPVGSESRLKAYQELSYTLGSACYIQGALSTLLLLAHDFADDFCNGILTNANCGGENVHRGAALGALLAASAVNQGKEIPPNWKTKLHSSKETIIKLLKNKI